MSRWAERLKAKYARPEISKIPETANDGPTEGNFGDNGDFGNGTVAESKARAVAEPDWWCAKPPPAGSAVARIIEAGGTSRIGGDGKRLHREAILPAEAALTNAPYRGAALPAGAVAELIAELEADGWHVLRTLETAQRAVPRPDLDPAEWCGEVEDLAPTAAGDFGDEREHDRWLADSRQKRPVLNIA